MNEIKDKKYEEDDSCDPLIRIEFIHKFLSLIIKFIGFEMLNVFYQTFKIHNSRFFQTNLQYTILKAR